MNNVSAAESTEEVLTMVLSGRIDTNNAAEVEKVIVDATTCTFRKGSML